MADFEGTDVMYLYILLIFILILFYHTGFIYFILILFFILGTAPKHRCYGD